jgi:hypothetical protein
VKANKNNGVIYETICSGPVWRSVIAFGSIGDAVNLLFGIADRSGHQLYDIPVQRKAKSGGNRLADLRKQFEFSPMG